MKKTILTITISLISTLALATENTVSYPVSSPATQAGLQINGFQSLTPEEQVKACVEECFAAFDKPSAELKACVTSCAQK